VEQDQDLLAYRRKAVHIHLHLAQHSTEITEVRDDALRASIDAAVGHVRGVVPLDLIAPERTSSIDAPCVPGQVVAAHDLHVLLRHRPPSIPPPKGPRPGKRTAIRSVG